MRVVRFSQSWVMFILSLVKAENSKKILAEISKKLDFAKPGHGIAFTVPLESIAGIMSFKFLTADLTEEV